MHSDLMLNNALSNYLFDALHFVNMLNHALSNYLFEYVLHLVNIAVTAGL